jgi:isorenieratene synthase
VSKVWRFGKVLPDVPSILKGPDWSQADPRWINRALAITQSRPTGGWYVVDGSRAITDKPKRYRIMGKDWVLFRDGHGVIAGPDRCPHMGASMADGHVHDGCVVCPWHALALGRKKRGSWDPLKVHDDGILVWVQLPDPNPTDKPFIAPRPAAYFDAVMRMEARCHPSDIVANRLDPWHGVHFHPHSFGTLKIVDRTEDDITVRVAYRVVGKLAVEVDARFHSPEPNSIVMTIIDGEGVGSMVETHGSPVDDTHAAVIEATIATSERPGFHQAVKWLGRWIRPEMEARASRRWVEDLAYAERRQQLRDANQADGNGDVIEPD